VGQADRSLLKAAILAISVGALLPFQPLEAKQKAAEIGTVQLAALPAEAQATERLIRAGGPFPYPKDGSVFGNYERQLPRKARGFYREYTVPTPKARNRGPKRIVCGGTEQNHPEACYYTDDHYASFRRIVQ
jgi:ribonuclease T1